MKEDDDYAGSTRTSAEHWIHPSPTRDKNRALNETRLAFDASFRDCNRTYGDDYVHRRIVCHSLHDAPYTLATIADKRVKDQKDHTSGKGTRGIVICAIATAEPPALPNVEGRIPPEVEVCCSSL